MMVNIGGFVGPIVAGIVRAWDWNYVFIASQSGHVVRIPAHAVETCLLNLLPKKAVRKKWILI